MLGQTTEAGPGLVRLLVVTRKAAPMPGLRHSLVRRRCRRAAEAAVGIRGAERPAGATIQAMEELKAEAAVKAEVAPQVVTLAVVRGGTLVVEAPAGTGLTVLGIRCWPSFTPWATSSDNKPITYDNAGTVIGNRGSRSTGAFQRSRPKER